MRSKHLLHELDTLQEQGVLDEATASRIRAHYEQQGHADASGNRLLLVFGIFGALLVGLGLLLLVAHNWDQFPRSVKLLFAFLPLLLAQGMATYVFFRKPDNRAWREGAAVFWVLCLGACLALISQIYHLEGRMSSFLLSWLLPGLPIVYLLRSSLASLMYWFGISWYAASLGYFEYPNQTPWLYIPLAALALPAYWRHWMRLPQSNFTRFHHVVVPLSGVVVLGAFGSGPLMVSAYIALFGGLLWAGSRPSLGSHWNGYRIVGTFGLLILLLVLSFEGFWEEWARAPFLQYQEGKEMQALLLNAALWGTLFALALRSLWKRSFPQDGLLAGALLFLPVLLLGKADPLGGQIATNILLLGISVAVMWQGTRHDDLRQLNLGLLSLTALIACRFFDMNLSFGIRGLLFVLLGLGFFLANYRIIQKRKHRL